MEVTTYSYQSPYASPVQFGRANANAQKDESQTQELLTQTNDKFQEAQQFQTTQTQEVQPAVEMSKLDLYA